MQTINLTPLYLFLPFFLFFSDIPLSYGLYDVNVDSRKLNSVEIVWDPAKDAAIFIKVIGKKLLHSCFPYVSVCHWSGYCFCPFVLLKSMYFSILSWFWIAVRMYLSMRMLFRYNIHDDLSILYVNPSIWHRYRYFHYECFYVCMYVCVFCVGWLWA